MNYVHVDHLHMLALFLGVEEEQPFRHQPEVLLLVDFLEYKQFVLQLVRSKRHWLYLPFEQYEAAVNASDGDVYLRKLYYFDMSRAMLSEVLKSGELGCESTVIGTAFEGVCNADAVLLSNARELAAGFSAYNKSIASVKKDMAQFFVQGGLSVRNQQILEYVVFLRTLAFERRPKTYEFKI